MASSVAHGCAWVCLGLSASAVCLLSVWGVLLVTHSMSFPEVPVAAKTRGGIVCFVAAGMYFLTGAISLIVILMNRKEDRTSRYIELGDVAHPLKRRRFSHGNDGRDDDDGSGSLFTKWRLSSGRSGKKTGKDTALVSPFAIGRSTAARGAGGSKGVRQVRSRDRKTDGSESGCSASTSTVSPKRVQGVPRVSSNGEYSREAGVGTVNRGGERCEMESIKVSSVMGGDRRSDEISDTTDGVVTQDSHRSEFNSHQHSSLTGGDLLLSRGEQDESNVDGINDFVDPDEHVGDTQRGGSDPLRTRRAPRTASKGQRSSKAVFAKRNKVVGKALSPIMLKIVKPLTVGKSHDDGREDGSPLTNPNRDDDEGLY
eukprot:GHVN01032837.1.p1 GENE.GHVN01032837.1~~GHVN01032837.1.p1  ORF type:complete len:370 (-),score=69.51 GHVN01032837.1:1155-2264(-)